MDVTLAPKNWRALIKPKGIEVERDSLTDTYGKFVAKPLERGFGCILTGYIVERQRDRETAESKYVVQGKTLTGDDAIIVAKLGPTGKLVILTTYSL